MKSKNILFLTIILCSYFANGQTKGKAYYKKQSSHNFSGIIDNSSKAKSSFKNVNNSINNMEFILTFNDTMATYEEVKKIELDTEKISTDLSRVFSGYKGPYYFDLKSKKYLRKQGKYLIEYDLKTYDWTLTKDKIIIDSMTCYKATTELKLQGRRGEIIRPVTAWYTTDVNLQIGPDGFGGLPGLIIQVETDNVITTLTKIEFTKKSIKLNFPDKGELISEDAYNELIKDLVENRKKHYRNN